jgi:two-component system, cell cycle sensor histidine kinase and response regulator CckA
MLLKQIKELQELLLGSERKADILTNLLKEAGAEYEQSLKKIQVSEANFRAIFENAPEAIYIIDVSSRRILDCNPFIQKWLGYSREELLTMRVDQILSPGAENVRKNIQKAVRDGWVYVQERRFQKKDGKIVDAEVTGTTMDYEGQRCFVALIRDVTERKKIEALRRYKELFESVSDAVFINDEKGQFLEVNDVACHCLGYSRDQFLRRTLRDVTCPEDYAVLSEMAKQISKGRPYQFELSLISRNGVVIPFEFQGRIISYQTRAAFLSVARDMSLRKNLQETLIKTERLSAVGEMASGVAHNFNNLLQMIMASAEAAKAKLKSGNILDCQEAIGNIIMASQRGADVVRRIKDFTLLTPDDLSDGTVFDLEILVAEAIKLTQPFWKPPSAPGKYQLNFVTKGNCYIKGKSSEIYEVLVNLIKNALEAMPDGGNINLRSHSQDDRVYLKIEDTGKGIRQEHLQRIFVPFFTTKGTRSSGLGLSSCYGIVKKHHGEILVESKLGQGTEFLLSFPKSHSPVAVEEAKRGVSAIQTQTPIRFLLIDDEINILKSVEMYFEDTEIDITTAKTAHDGLTAIGKDRFDVILCDLSMDDMNGLEVGRWVLDFCHRKGIAKPPFLLYTGLNKELHPAKLTESGIDRVVNKPTACEELLHIIREISLQ